MEKLHRIYKDVLKGKHMNIIPHSKQVKVDELPPGICHLQITTIKPVMRGERNMRACGFDHFSFETYFSKDQTTQGGIRVM